MCLTRSHNRYRAGNAYTLQPINALLLMGYDLSSTMRRVGIHYRERADSLHIISIPTEKPTRFRTFCTKCVEFSRKFFHTTRIFRAPILPNGGRLGMSER